MKFCRLICIAVLAVCFLPSQLRADLIVSWDVSGVDVDTNFGPAPYTFNATTSATNASGSLQLGAGVNPSTSNNQYGFKVSAVDTQNSLAGAITNNHYIEFSVTVDNGFQLDLENITMNGESSGTGADDVALMTSIDGFVDGNEIASVSGIAGNTGGFDTDGSGFGGPIDMSAAKYQNLTGTITFRLYGYNTSSGAGVTYLRNLSGDDLVINGTISAVPEPATFIFLSLLAGTFLFVRYRRHKHASLA